MMNKSFFERNRKKIFDIMTNDSILILSSGVIYRSTADNDFNFEIDRSFYYFTGINQDQVKLVLVKINNKTDELLFIDENDLVKVKWVGAKLYPNEATNISGINKVLFNSEFDKVLDSYKDQVSTVYLNFDNIFFM